MIKKLKTKLLNEKNRIFFRMNYPEYVKMPLAIKTDMIHLQATMKWLCHAQDVTGCGGISACYYLNQKKWGKPYRETTGYIINTFLNYYFLTKKKNYLSRAVKMANWLIEVQSSDGSWGEINNKGNLSKKVFNTGQIILGLCNIFKHTKNKKYLLSAIKASDWLLNIQESDGSWKKFTTKGAKTYHSRVAWALLEVYLLTKKNKYKLAAKRNIEWVLRQQTSNGWFKNTSLSEENKPWTHLIAYTLSGLLEYHLIESDEKVFQAVYKACKKMLEYYNFLQRNNSFEYFQGTLDNNWSSYDKSSCLTGNAQIAIIWLKLYIITKEKDFYEAATKLINQLKETHIIISKNNNIKGGVAGSYPIDGMYCGYMIINWGAKFFADSLMLKMHSDMFIKS